MKKRLYTWTEKEGKNLAKSRQYFCKRYSTTDHIFIPITMVKRKLNNKRGGNVHVAFIDYKKAFDTVDREKLWKHRKN